ncbi:MAG TPA: MMPL family transporter [Gaiellaceae bacterium]|nr:MMPL family transporter [Gaiellaceae bacterium]
MHGFMVRLSHAVRRRRWIVIGIWIALVAFSAPFARMNGDNLSAGFSGVPGSQSETVQDALDDGDFGAAGEPQIGVVVDPASGATPAQVADAVNRIEAAAKETDDVQLTNQALQQAQQAAQAVQPFIVPVRIQATQTESVDITEEFSERIDAGQEENGVTLDATGQSALQAEQLNESQAGTETAADVSLVVMLVLLLAAFGGLVATLVPLVLGFAAVTVTGMVIYFLSQAVTISIFATSLAAMIGLAVAVDYSLFILLRYRDELAGGATRERALETAMSTSLIAVLFSGTTVIVSLAGLFLVPNATVRSMAVGAIIVVAVSLLAAATLLSALVTVLGRFAEGRGPAGHALARVGAVLSRGKTTTFWERQTARATRFPWLTVAGTLAVLVLLALPTLRITLNESSVQQLPEDNQARQGTELAGQIAGLGSTAPTLVLVQLDSGTVASQSNQQVLAGVEQVINGEQGVASSAGPQPSTDDRSALYSVQLWHSPETEAAKDAVRQLRDDLAASPAAEAAAISVGGLTATEVDFRASISGSMWKIVLFILATSFLILMVLLRSLVLPLVGVAMNVLCVGASYGVLVAVFQWGWLDFLGLTDFGYVNSVILPLLLAIVFGLSMDYQVFLLTRIRERYLGGEPTRAAALAGTSAAARTITAAAAIMIGVFVVFAIFGVPTIEAAGLGAAVAVAASALLVQLAFMPALIVLLGDRVWWLPGWLDRVLPAIELD